MSNFKPLAVEGTIHWAFLNKTNDLSGKYQADIGNLSDAAIKALEQVGVQIKNKGDDRGNFITGKSNRPIATIDAQGNYWNADSQIGNNSKVKAVLGFYDHKFVKQYGTGVGLNKVVVLDHVPYGNAATEDEVL